jgi:hypothetical protein
MERRESAERALLFALLVVGILVAFGDVIGPDRLLYNRDHSGLYRPYWEAAISSLRRGELPSLTRADPSGAPLEACPIGIYSPLTLILFLSRDLVWTWDLFVVAHFILLAGGALILARTLGADTVGAFAAATVASLAGPVISFENLTLALMGFAWAPWVYAAFVRMLRAPSPLTVGLLALALGFHLQTPEPVLALLDLAAGLAIVLVVRPRLTRALVLAGIAALVLGLAIASVSLMPVLEFLPAARRGGGFSYTEASQWSLHPAQLVELIAPSFWTPPDALFVNVPEISGDPRGPYLYSLYFGTALFLAPAAMFAPIPRRARVALACGVVLSLLIAAGPLTPIHRALWSLPILRSGRYPVKYTLITTTCFAALAPLAVLGAKRKPQALVVSSAVGLLASIVLLQVASSAELARFLEGAVKPAGELRYQGLDAASMARIAVEHMTGRALHGLILCAMLGLAALALLRRPSKRTELAVPMIVLIDLATGARFSVFGASVESTQGPSPPIVERLKSDDRRVFFLLPDGRGAEIAHQDGGTYFEDYVRSKSARGHWLHDGVRRFEELDRNALSNAHTILAFRLLAQARGDRALRILARAGVAWIGSWIDIPGHPESMIAEVPGEPPERFTPIEGVRPYARAYARWRSVDDSIPGHDLFELLADEARWNDAVLWSPGQGDRTATSSACEAMQTVEIEPDRAPERIALRYRGPCEALLVVLESVVPGWTVSVDSAPTELLEAELGFIAARVPAGEHRVLFTYAPKNRRWAKVALAAFLASLGALSLGLRRSAPSRRRWGLSAPTRGA